MNRLYPLSLSQLRVFLSAAETLNFTRTAETFALTQSAVSKMIAGLEQELSLALFTRANNRLALTNAGRYLAEEWTPLLGGFERTFRDASRIAARDDRIAFGVPDSLASDVLLPYLAPFRASFPEVRVVFHVLPASLLVPKLASGELDFIVTGVYEQGPLEALGFRVTCFRSLPDVVYLHRSNPLAARETLSLRDLAEEEIIMPSPAENAAYFEKIYSLFAEQGLTPRFAPFAPNFRSMIENLIRNGSGAVVSNEWIDGADDPALVRFPIPGTFAGMIVAWSDKNPNGAVARLAECFPAEA